MAAPPNVAIAAAQAVLDLTNDNPGLPQNVRAARSSKRLKIAHGLHETGIVTEAEVGDHEVFHVQCATTAAGVGGGGVGGGGVGGGGAPPGWFGPALAAGLANINATLANINARQMNSVASDSTDPLIPLTNAAGVPAANFPATLRALITMNGAAMTALLGHYGLPVGGSNDAKRQRIKKFIGMRIA